MSLSYFVEGICQHLRLLRNMLRCKPSQRQGCLTGGFDWIPTGGWQTKGVVGSAPGPGSISHVLGFDGPEGVAIGRGGLQIDKPAELACVRKVSADIFRIAKFSARKTSVDKF